MSLFEPIFEAMNRTGVRYVVVGGLATVLHAGRPQDAIDIEALEDIMRRKAGDARRE